ncbi:uncharacterized protein K02A2.6-like [Eupeodes corollae]|uniref:uncharacterized protein K02A2.6-like n=1 Tax=Eupeodes corollae TaxID=290404 RepID=UPI002491ADD5|nr:uncharacterized protein K02A2.6-like [Eupeodes corollae]
MITKLSELFFRYGDCKQLVSNSGIQFISAEFQSFIKSRGIQHLRTTHPQTNGQVERFVDTLKRSLKKIKQEGTSQQKLETFLQTYRSTPNQNLTNFKSPAEAFLSRKIRTSLDLLKRKENPPTTRNEKQNIQYNKHHGAKDISLQVIVSMPKLIAITKNTVC